ncbi:uncharacterized protein F4812DRAFT_429338, partial [Daldinia caldariorum]|uniref:uncharacterized protein n=1 Tax=Daldinia caldariorum TaxID=326644 RepID=UPI0020080362
MNNAGNKYWSKDEEDLKLVCDSLVIAILWVYASEYKLDSEWSFQFVTLDSDDTNIV